MIILAIGLALFLGIHLVRVVAPGWREAQIAQRGEGPWKGIYSGISFLGLALIIYGYWVAETDYLFTAPDWARTATLLAMPIALILVVASDLKASRIKRAFRHPMTFGVIIWSFVHLMVNGDTASTLLFGAVLAWAIIVLISAFRRPSVEVERGPLWRDLAAIAVGLVLTALLMAFLHEWLFGVSPVI